MASQGGWNSTLNSVIGVASTGAGIGSVFGPAGSIIGAMIGGATGMVLGFSTHNEESKKIIETAKIKRKENTQIRNIYCMLPRYCLLSDSLPWLKKQGDQGE